MAYREVTMIKIKEVLRLRCLGAPKKRIAAQLRLDPKTVRRYVEVGEACTSSTLTQSALSFAACSCRSCRPCCPMGSTSSSSTPRPRSSPSGATRSGRGESATSSSRPVPAPSRSTRSARGLDPIHRHALGSGCWVGAASRNNLSMRTGLIHQQRAPAHGTPGSARGLGPDPRSPGDGPNRPQSRRLSVGFGTRAPGNARW